MRDLGGGAKVGSKAKHRAQECEEVNYISAYAVANLDSDVVVEQDGIYSTANGIWYESG